MCSNTVLCVVCGICLILVATRWTTASCSSSTARRALSGDTISDRPTQRSGAIPTWACVAPPRRNSLCPSLLSAIDQAEQFIFLTTAYFVPDRMLLEALQAAARRGVDVRVLIPWVSNHVLADWVAHSYFTDCLQGGVRIFGYRYTMLHAKTCTIDGQWSTVGTCNLDRLSLVGNYEINVAVYSTEFARQMSALFTEDTAKRFELTMEQWESRPWYIKVSERILAPLRIMM